MIIPQSRRHTYTVRIVSFFLAAACVLLLVCAENALVSASEALILFSTRVLPALFPFYVLTSMLFRLGAFDRLRRFARGAFLPCCLTGAAAGNPNGARLCVLLKSEAYAAACSLCNPMFLLGVVAIGMYGNTPLFWPLAIAHYGSALLLALLCRSHAGEAHLPEPAPAQTDARVAGIFADIGGGALAMLNIGGCIVFFYVLADALIMPLIPDSLPLLAGIAVGVMEMTAGCARIASMSLPLPVQAGLLAFVTTFGGLCVFAQVMVTAPLRRPGAFLLQKLMQGCMAGILAFLLAPLFVDNAAPAFSSNADMYAQNALIGLTFLLCAGVGLVASYVLALLAKRARAHGPGSQSYLNSRRPRRRPPR